MDLVHSVGLNKAFPGYVQTYDLEFRVRLLDRLIIPWTAVSLQPVFGLRHPTKHRQFETVLTSSNENEMQNFRDGISFVTLGTPDLVVGAP